MPKLYTIPDAAVILSVHPQTIKRWAKKGLIELILLPGRDWRISEDELQRILQGKPVDG